MSVTKLLSRIVAPDDILSKEDEDDQKVSKDLHDHTFGITSDPLTQLAVVISALIHDGKGHRSSLVHFFISFMLFCFLQGCHSYPDLHDIVFPF